MKIRNTDRGEKPKAKGGSESTGIKDPLPMKPPEETRYSTKEIERRRKERERLTAGTTKGAVVVDEHGNHINVAPYRKSDKDRRFAENRGPKKSLKSAPMTEARPHTIWVRRDIWAAVELYKAEHRQSIRSVVEQALYNFLLKEQRVTNTEDLGEDPKITSWRMNNED